ncbi:Glycine cleavage system transcriptional activator [plant metagenome]|uniref:Glycine cleavage system transcriptional activator n=1 Tax=plant metagenome TaxID=1297885 RepID=A0A484XGY2_9ZZZZ
MRRFCPSLTELIAFESAARHGSFTRAAEELCVTQGAVSKQVKSLEATVGVELFLRVRQGLMLTDAGRGYLSQIKGGLDQIETASLDLLSHRGQGGLLTLTSMPTFGAKWLIPRLTAFLRLRPDIRMEFLPHHRGYDFSMPKLDAAVRYGEGLWPGARADYLGGREVVPVCKPQLIAGGERQPADLLRYPLLHHTTAPQGWHEWFERAGCASARSWEGSRFDQYSLLTEAAAAGFGLALIPRCLVEDELRDGKLEVAVNLPILASQGYYLCYPEQKATLPALLAFRTWLLTQVEADPLAA